MVRTHRLLLALLSVCLFSSFAGFVKGWSGTYHLDQESVKIWINQDGTIDLFYNITIALESGDNINFVSIGQPTRDFTIGEAQNQYGHSLACSDVSSGSSFKVRVDLYPPLTEGEAVWFTLITNVAHMIYNDTTNPGNVGMQFIPTWWSASVKDLRIMIALPEGVSTNMTRTSTDYSGTFAEEGRLTVYWEKHSLAPDEQYPVGISFPKEYVQHYDAGPGETVQPSEPDYSSAVFLIIFFFVVGFFVLVAIVAVAKKTYLVPHLSMETLGIKRGLTAVEASYLLDMKPTRIVTEILYSLLKKRAVWVEESKPSIRLRIMPEFQNRKGTRETPLRYYEIDFLDAINKEGRLDEEKLASTVMALRDNVEEQMRGYCRKDTAEYYRSIVTKAWEQVEQAGAPELASTAYDEQLLWLMLDPDFQPHTQTIFRSQVFQPSPFWLWYWYGYQHYYPNSTYRPNIETPTQSAKPPPMPGADFANNIATSVEKTSNNIVTNIEKFAGSIVPAPSSKTSTQPAHHNATCVCACHACACACACVSCACACAGGGVG